MATKKILQPYADFRRGLNLSAAPDALLEVEVLQADNIELYARGGYRKRNGYIERYNPLPAVTKATTKQIIFKGVKYVIKDSSLVRVSDNAVIKSGFASPKIDYDIANGRLLILDGTEYYEYDGTTFKAVVADAGSIDLALIRRCKYIKQRGQRLFFAGDPQFPNTIYFMEIGFYNKMLSTGSIDAVSDDNDVLIGVDEFHGAMIAFKKNHIYAWTGYDVTSDVYFKKIATHKGTVSDDTIVSAANMLIYAATDGIYALVGLEENVISSVNIAKAVSPMFDKIINTGKATATFHKGRYLLSCTMEGTYYTKLQGDDFTSLDTTTSSEVDFVKASPSKFALAPIGTVGIDNTVTITGVLEASYADIQLENNAGNFYYAADKTLWLSVHKGKYANITEARAGLGSLYATYSLSTEFNNHIIVAYVDMKYADDAGEMQFPITVHKGMPVASWSVDTDDKDKLYFGSDIDGKVHEAYVGYSDNGAAICERVRHRFNLNTMFGLKKIKKIFVAAQQFTTESSNMRLTAQADYITRIYEVAFDESLVYAEGNWGDTLYGWVDAVTKEIRLSLPATNRVELIIENFNNNEPLLIHGIGFEYKEKKAKGGRTGIEYKGEII